MTQPIEVENFGPSFIDHELSSAILRYLLQGHVVMLDSDTVPESHLETLFENIRDDLLMLVKHGEISHGRLQKALANLVTKSSFDGTDSKGAASILPTIVVRMHMLASIEECS